MQKKSEDYTYEPKHQPVCVSLFVLRSFAAEHHNETHDGQICRNILRTDMSGILKDVSAQTNKHAQIQAQQKMRPRIVKKMPSRNHKWTSNCLNMDAFTDSSVSTCAQIPQAMRMTSARRSLHWTWFRLLTTRNIRFQSAAQDNLHVKTMEHILKKLHGAPKINIHSAKHQLLSVAGTVLCLQSRDQQHEYLVL